MKPCPVESRCTSGYATARPCRHGRRWGEDRPDTRRPPQGPGCCEAVKWSWGCQTQPEFPGCQRSSVFLDVKQLPQVNVTLHVTRILLELREMGKKYQTKNQISSPCLTFSQEAHTVHFDHPPPPLPPLSSFFPQRKRRRNKLGFKTPSRF